MHLPRSYQTQVELEELAAVPKQVVSPQASKPVIGLVQDSMLACFRWTMSDEYLNARQVMKLLAWTSSYDGFLPEPEDVSGWKAHSILSSVLPKFTYVRKDKNQVKNCQIVHGKFEEGVWSSKSVGGKISNLVHAIWKDYGHETTRLFLDNMMNLTMQWLLMDGFSVGIRDANIDEKTQKEVRDIIEGSYVKVSKKIADLREGKFEVKFSNIGLEEQFENEMFELLNKVRNDAQSATYNSLDNNNRIYATVTSGSKGKPANMVQISSLLGQQALEGGKRIHGGYSHRTLPHYAKYDMRPESHGFIQGNYINGLNPAEWFMHAMSGREGVISTAIKTAITGYTQRKLIKVMEDIKVNYDNTVRMANNFMISHIYGTDGFDASKLEKAKIKHFTMDPESNKFKNEFLWTEKELKDLLTAEAYQVWLQDIKTNSGDTILEEEFEQIKEDRLTLREKMYPHWSEHGPVYTPINFPRILDWVKYTCGLENETRGALSPLEVIQKVNALIKDINISKDPIVSNVCTRHFKFLIRYWLHSKRLISQYKFNRVALDLMLLKVKEHYHDSLINPGEMVGIIAAQSIGEPLTQLTLDSFHQSGLGSRSKKLSEVPRLREIFSTTANLKTPFINIYLKPSALGVDDQISHEEVIRRGEDILDKIQFTTLNSLVSSYQILFDPDEKNTIVEEDRNWLKRAHQAMGHEDIETPWLIRMVFNNEKIQNLALGDIKNILEDEVSTDDINLYVLHNPQNSPQVIMRVRVSTSSQDPKKDLKDIMKTILTTPVKGVPQIMGGNVMSEDMDLYMVDGKFVSKESAEYEKDYKYKNKEEKALNPMYQQYLIQTEGTNLFDVMALDDIDIYRTYSNDLHETLDVLGIEAARELIIKEIVSVFAFGGKSLNNRHLGVLADVMTAQGQLVSTDRYGINKLNTGVLSKATFETTTNQIANASIFGEEDPMKGVSSKIMFGEFFEGGTNAFNIMLDEEMIMDNVDQLFYPKKLVVPRNVEFQEQETLGSCQNLDFEFAL